ncbi:hypothetical protein MD588_25265 [Photobacterium sp. SDRW27]|uniref:hypothetical protein n=1 Tax=Photobacterium obscurum TaxID=2829490 RepID=UPI0022442FD8|nr:hypothetical protein [Photobacterium obscurum]MCW8332106.1 hypothetical protein [Photobacterium obscurum]
MINAYGSVTTYNQRNINLPESLLSPGRKKEGTIPTEHRTEGEVDVRAAFDFLKKLLGVHGLNVEMNSQTMNSEIKLIDAETGEVIKRISSADIAKAMRSARKGTITDIEV